MGKEQIGWIDLRDFKSKLLGGHLFVIQHYSWFSRNPNTNQPGLWNMFAQFD